MDDSINQVSARKVVRKIKNAISWNPGLKPSWTIDQARAAVVEHLNGEFQSSALLVEAMLSDDELPTSIQKAVTLIVNSTFALNPITKQGTDEPDENSAKQAEFMYPYWSQIADTRELGKLVQWWLMLGVGIGELVWDKRDPLCFKPKLKVLHPSFLHVDQSKVQADGTRGVFMYQSESGMEEVVPGDGRWVLLGDRHSYMNCGLRALCATWLSKQYALRDWNRYNERHGLPILKAKVPVDASKEDKERLYDDLSGMGSETIALLPCGIDQHGTEFDLELEEATDGSWECFQALIQRCDRKYQMYFHGTNANELLDASGSRNTTQSGRDIAKERADEREREIMPWIQSQIVKPFCRVNIPDADPTMTPMPHFKVLGDADSFKEAEASQKLFEAITAAKNAGYKVKNAEKLAMELGLDIEVDEEAQEMAREAHEASIAPKDSSKTSDSNRDRSREQPQERTNGRRVEQE
jgi:hypothetical protein